MEDIWKPLERIVSLGYNRNNVFNDWMDLIIYALLRNEQEYMRITKTYNNTGQRGKRPADYFAEAYGLLCLKMKEESADWIGRVYEAYISVGDHGQFFTPETVAELMAQIGMPEQEKNGRFYYADPACGSGRCLLSIGKRVKNGFAVGVDIDVRCCKMAAINYVHRNMSGIFIHGNSLSAEAWQAWEIKSSPFGASIHYYGNEYSDKLTAWIVPQAKGNHPQKPANELNQLEFAL